MSNLSAKTSRLISSVNLRPPYFISSLDRLTTGFMHTSLPPLCKKSRSIICQINPPGRFWSSEQKKFEKNF